MTESCEILTIFGVGGYGLNNWPVTPRALTVEQDRAGRTYGGLDCVFDM